MNIYIKKLGFILIVALVLVGAFSEYQLVRAATGGGTATIAVDGGTQGAGVTVVQSTSHIFTTVFTVNVSGYTLGAASPTFAIPAGFTAPNASPVANAGLVNADGKWSVVASGGGCTVDSAPGSLLTTATGQVITVDITADCANGHTITLTYKGTSSVAMGATQLVVSTADAGDPGPVTPLIAGSPTITVTAASATLNVIKHVINDNGGTAVASAWTLAVSSSNLGSGTGSATGTEVGTAYTLQAGKAYSVAESGGPSGYSESDSANCTIASAVASTVYTCTITNDDVAPVLHLRKTVDNTGGGTALNTAWTLTATGALGSPTNLSGTTPVDSGGTFKADTYTLAESGAPASYTASVYSCVKNGGGAVVSNSIILANGDTATCTITNTFVPATTETLTVIKLVVGGTKVVADFPLFVNGSAVTSGATNSFAAPATYTITETSNANYTASYSGFCPDGILSLTLGTPKICTITNTYTAPVVASPSPSGGGGSYYPPVPPLIDVVKVPSPLALPDGPGTVKYTYTLRNIGTVPVTKITMVGDTCSPITFISGDTSTDPDPRLDVNETWIYTCSTTLSKTHTNIITATGWANGITAVDVATATVVVGVPIIPPLIHVTKVPNPLLLPTLGGTVMYTNKVTNPGTVPLVNVRLTDDKCSPVKYISGDTNGDSKLDTTETWTYTCSSNLTKTTTNTIIASGDANNLTATDFAIATVVVPTLNPRFPSTGFPPFPPREKNFLERLIDLWKNY